jgi:hypothetical protein
MKANRFWIELVTLCITIACALALLFATLGAAAGAATGEPESAQAVGPSTNQQQSYEGVVTCTRCGARHQTAIGKAPGDCALVCVHGGARFALVDGDKTYLLAGDLAGLRRIAGQRARIMGTLDGNTITVDSVSPPN